MSQGAGLVGLTCGGRKADEALMRTEASTTVSSFQRSPAAL
jgi:hypothetical protein